MNVFDAIILGIVEGLTEFLPVSSTGHMILTTSFLKLEQSDVVKSFEVVVQLGSILAVVAAFWRDLRLDKLLWCKLLVGCLPAAVVGFFAYSFIKTLFTQNVVAYALIIGGFIFIAIELWHKKTNFTPYVTKVEDISFKEAFLVGCAQILAMIPGTSRSGATIVAGLLGGFSRQVAAKFSFFLAIPTMFAATFYDIYKQREIFLAESQNILIFLIGGVVAFLVALVVIGLFMKFVSKFSYITFGIYRILAGVCFLWLMA